jgi:hypothetical protein
MPLSRCKCFLCRLLRYRLFRCCLSSLLCHTLLWFPLSPRNLYTRALYFLRCLDEQASGKWSGLSGVARGVATHGLGLSTLSSKSRAAGAGDRLEVPAGSGFMIRDMGDAGTVYQAYALGQALVKYWLATCTVARVDKMRAPLRGRAAFSRV